MGLEIPPNTVDDLNAALRDQTKLVYLVNAAKSSGAWANALAAEQDLPGTAAFRAQNRQDVATWLKDTDKVAAIFDWKGNVKRLLTKAEAEDKDLVEQAISDAMGGA